MNDFESDWTPFNMKPIVIIGAGMAGISAAFELKRLGIAKVILIDKSPKGKEGPWITSARMRHLRSGKSLLGPAIQFPQYSFENYYKKLKGLAAWDTLYKIPNSDWEAYLLWLRETLNLHVINQEMVEKLEPSENSVVVKTDKSLIDASKVIIATGRGGFGGPNYPDWINEIDPKKFIHTSEIFDMARIKGLKVAVVGTGASGLDAAGAALEAGAQKVDLLSRQKKINNVNKGIATAFSGYSLGYYYLSDIDKLRFSEAHAEGLSTPPFESLLRIKGYPNLRVIFEYHQPPRDYDFIILATGYKIDASQVPYLKGLAIDLWENHLSQEEKNKYPFALKSPYLGEYFELLPFKNIYCFNYGASLSHGNISGDIPGIGIGANKLARGISIDIFLKFKEHFYHELKEYNVHEFEEGL